MIHGLKLGFLLEKRIENTLCSFKEFSKGLLGASGGELQTVADRLSPTFSEPNSHQMISLKLINILRNEIMLPVSFMKEDVSSDLSPGGHVPCYNACRMWVIQASLPLFPTYLVSTYYGVRKTASFEVCKQRAAI